MSATTTPTSYAIEAEAEGWVDKMSGRLIERRSNDPWERFYQQHLPTAPHLPESHQRLWLYYKLWPNMAFDIYPDQVDFMQWLPLSPTVSVLREMCFALPDDRREMKLVRYANWRINRTVNAEDTWLIERVQQGMASQSYEIGPIGASEVCLRSFARKIRERIPEARLHRAPSPGWSATSSPSRLREGSGEGARLQFAERLGSSTALPRPIPQAGAEKK
jgi:phenylpropionate dioxygenase-like ring-hydroxylating dioxygenase large terminal subunit